MQQHLTRLYTELQGHESAGRYWLYWLHYSDSCYCWWLYWWQTAGSTGYIAVTGYTTLLPTVSPCSALIRDVHESHVMVLGGAVAVAMLALEAGQTRLLHAGLLPQQGASGGGGPSSGSSAPSGPRSWRKNKNVETRSNGDVLRPEGLVSFWYLSCTGWWAEPCCPCSGSCDCPSLSVLWIKQTGSEEEHKGGCGKVFGLVRTYWSFWANPFRWRLAGPSHWASGRPHPHDPPGTGSVWTLKS